MRVITFIRICSIAMFLVMAAAFQWKEPTSPILAKLICIPILFPAWGLTKDGIRFFIAKRTPPTPPLPRRERRELARANRRQLELANAEKRINKLIRQKLAGQNRKRFQQLLGEMESELGRKLNGLEMKELVAYTNGDDPRTATTPVDIID